MRLIARGLLILSLLVLTLGAVFAASTNDASRLIMIQMGNDMTYGADEYFGDSRDLLYVDQVTPAVSQPAAPVAVVQSVSQSSSRSRSRSDSEETVSSSSTTASSSESAAPGKPKPTPVTVPPTDPTPVILPPPEPPPLPPPCPS